MRVFPKLFLTLCILFVASFTHVRPAAAQVVKPVDKIFVSNNPLLQPLFAEIALAKQNSATKFADAKRIPAHVASINAKKRGPFLPLGSTFKALGADMVLPIADVVYSEYKSPTLKNSARVSFMVGAFEGFAHHQNQAVAPLLFAVLQTETNLYIVRAASEAIGRLGTDAHIIDLLVMSAASNDIRAGLRGCRRTACARYLTTYLATNPTTDERRIALKALGSIGNAWAWQTDEVKSKDDGNVVRRIAAKTLVKQYADAKNANLRSTALKAILVVDHPETPAFIASIVKTATGDQAKHLDLLSQRFAKNPIR